MLSYRHMDEVTMDMVLGDVNQMATGEGTHFKIPLRRAAFGNNVIGNLEAPLVFAYPDSTGMHIFAMWVSCVWF